jgi:thermitase
MKLVKLLILCIILMDLEGCVGNNESLSIGNTNLTNEKNPPESLKAKYFPNDPFYNQQYYFDTMMILKAWEFTKGSPDCLIGVIERGIDANQPDLKNNVQEVHRLDDMEHPTDPRFNTHGTQISGIIAAEADNEIGIAGLAPDCKLVVARIGTHRLKRGDLEDKLKWNDLFGQKVSQSIKYLVDKGCKVINFSQGYTSTIRSAFEYAIENDVVIVVASGNGNRESQAYLPDDVLLVGGVDKKDNRYQDGLLKTILKGFKRQGSNYGESLDVVAPMCDLILCYPVGYATDAKVTDWDLSQIREDKRVQRKLFMKTSGEGTSYAAPMATSLVALIRSLRPDLDAKTVIEIVQKGADDMGKEGWDKYTGYGRINFYKSLKLAKSWPIL